MTLATPLVSFAALLAAFVAAAEPISPEPVSRGGRPSGQVLSDAVVVEAETAQYNSYGWQIFESPGASGNGFLYLKEGVGDVLNTSTGQVFDRKKRSGDFYNITRDNRPIEARCTFKAPQHGSYRLWVRTMAQRDKCSNRITTRVNRGRRMQVGDNGSTAHQWMWWSVSNVELVAGINTISFFTYQDDVKVDQAVFMPVRKRRWKPGRHAFYSGKHPMLVGRVGNMPTVTMTLTVPELPVTPGTNPRAAVYLRKNTSDAIRRTLTVVMDLPGDTVRKQTLDLALDGEAGLYRLNLDLTMAKVLDRREYLLRCTLSDGNTVEQKRTAVLQYGYDWYYLGPLPFIKLNARGAPESDAVPAASYTFAGKRVRWRRYSHRFTDHCGVTDWGLMFDDNLYQARRNAAVYVYTEVDAAKAGGYMLKVQGDDNHVVWINGAKVATFAKKGFTHIRSAQEVKIKLKKGRNRILIRINQIDGQWQSALRIRTAADTVATDVIGIPFAEQALGKGVSPTF